MYQVYINYSERYDRYYIGSAKNAKDRLEEHNNGKVKSTKAYLPWKTIYTENYGTRQEAYRREKKIKSYKRGRAFKNLINKNKFKE